MYNSHLFCLYMYYKYRRAHLIYCLFLMGLSLCYLDCIWKTQSSKDIPFLIIPISAINLCSNNKHRWESICLRIHVFHWCYKNSFVTSNHKKRFDNTISVFLQGNTFVLKRSWISTVFLIAEANSILNARVVLMAMVDFILKKMFL